MTNRTTKLSAAILLFTATTLAQSTYQKPSSEIMEVFNAPPPPVVELTPSRTHLQVLQGVRYSTIVDLSEPRLRLAGLRINPNNSGPHNARYFVGLSFIPVAGGAEIKVALPQQSRILRPRLTPDGRRFAFINLLQDKIELWTGEVVTGKATRIEGVQVNATLGEPFQWMPDGKTLLVQMVPESRGKLPEASKVPAGPVIQESSGRGGPIRTYQDMLTSAHDEALFEHFSTSQLALVSADGTSASAKPKLIGKPAVIARTDASPDSKYLAITLVEKPYSYLHPYMAFPRSTEIWNSSGSVIATVAKLPLADRVPIGGVQPGPRQINWHPVDPSTLIWVEAMDGGNPKEKVPHRDRILRARAPFDKPEEIAKTIQRYAGLSWTEKGDMAILRDSDRDRRWTETFLVKPGQAEPKKIWSLSAQDRYRDPGTPMMTETPSGHNVIHMDGNSIFLRGQGASPTGDRPFLDRFDLDTMKSQRLFRSVEGTYEQVVELLDDAGKRVITTRQSSSQPPNYFVRENGSDKLTQLTSFTDPAPQLQKIKKQLVTYKRADGVPLSFTLYLPPNYKPGTKLPAVMWSYPREYSDADTAGQVSGSTDRFMGLAGASHLYFLMNGYAVLDDATLPVIGDAETMNNTYLEQIVAGAKAAIQKGAEMGVVDPERVGVGGHSYGAFMTANLLAHSDLFRAGIARSGAYNRTLTPFGFQSERRTIWEAPDSYLRMSPFLQAQKINEPILLIHGEADDNTGTFPIQSERMYQAIRGNGGQVRYVVLPFEAHGYVARESIEHTLFEMTTWFDKYVKNAPPREPRSGAATSTGSQR